MSEAAAEADASIQNLVLAALYEHYKLPVPARQRERRYSEQLDRGSSRLVIRATPDLFEEVRKDADRMSGTMRQVIIDILTARFQKRF